MIEAAMNIADYLGSVFIGWYNSFVLYQDRNKILSMADFVIRQLKLYKIFCSILKRMFQNKNNFKNQKI
jgi:hypothetical protein